MKKFFTIILIATSIFAQKFEKLALTPPMGWNSWNKFGCNINEEIIKKMADAMVESGMKDAGYQYIIIDDCWQGQRDSLGFIQPDPERFPSGMKALADYIHSKGLKFGIYSDAGWYTCGGRPGSRGYEFQDAKKYAEWGVDYLKYDWCYTEGLNAEGAYLTMRNALYAAKRPIVFSICEWGNNRPWLWAKNIGHLWRTTGDITACFDCVVDHGTWKSWGVMQILDMQKGLRAYAGPDHWNDPDMLEVGNGMSVNEDRAHFSMWCMLAAPLIAGNDLSNMTNETKEILTNKEVIAVNQDSLGIQGFKYFENDGLEIWFKPLMHDNWAVCFLNRSTKPIELNFQWNNYIVIDSLFNKEANFRNNIYQIRDLWLKKDIGTTEKNFHSVIPSHDVIMLRLKPIKK
ncbi:MAG: glycoside hydrolase family 27 protein [Melioribacter sp.]|uniref:glycoside hydrolase family 27 protein n=1 Tax=Rosettibacter primus TaxID=3111523 RepID=UPI00247C9FDF|nr:glycoside hydrolase family 27 protein [Melioribacter sp.]